MFLTKNSFKTIYHTYLFFFKQGASLVSFSPDISRLLQLYDEEDDATSGLAAPKPDPDAQNATQDIAFHKVNIYILLVIIV